MSGDAETLVDMLLAGREHGDRVCFAFVPEGSDKADQEISYGDFVDRALRLAGGLQSRGVGAGTHMAVMAKPRVEYMLTMAAILLAGGVVVPVNHLFKRRELRAYLTTGDAHALLVDEYTAPVAAEVVDDLNLDMVVSTEEVDGLDTVTLRDLQRSEPATPANPRRSDLAVLMHTSGTTGLPKAVIRTHGTYADFARVWADNFLAPDDRLFSFMPMYHQAGFIVQWMPAYLHGAPFFQLERFSPEPFWGTIRRYGLTTGLFMPPVPHFLLLRPESDDDRNHPLRWAFGVAPAEQWRQFQHRFGIPMHGGYGSTETTMVGMSGSRSDGMLSDAMLDLPRGGSVMGKPIPGWCDIRIANDSDDGEAAPLELGEVQVRGPGVMTRYYNNPEATEQAFTADGWFKSGDVGYRTDDGRFLMVERTKNLIRRSGENIAPAELEAVLQDHPAVEEVAIVPVVDDLRGQEIRACIVPVDGYSLTAEEVFAFCRAELADFKVPRFVEFRDELPHTPTFKVQKEILVQDVDRSGWVDRNDIEASTSGRT